jgi:PAS domain S-box-containing protein
MIRLLLVDDEPVMLIVTKTYLEKDHADFECDTCSSAQEALEILAVSSYDAVISDYDMPEMDGIALLKSVRKVDLDLPFILLTGRSREEVVIEALNEGADFYLQKSQEPKILYAELASKIRYAVGRRRGKEALWESEAKYRTLFSNMVQGVFFQRSDGVLEDVNPAALAMFGLTRDQFLGRTSYDPAWRVVSEDGSIVPFERHPSMVALQTGKPVMNAVAGVYNPKRQGFTWMNINAIPQFRPGEDRPYQVFVTLHDITERKRAEEALRRSENRYRTLVENIHDVVYSYSLDGQITYISPNVQTYFGYTPSEMIGHSLFEYVHPEDREAVLRDFQRTITTSEEFTTYCRLIQKDGRVIHVEEIARKVVDGEGNIIGYFGVIRDITERKRAEEALRESEEKYRQLFESMGEAFVLHEMVYDEEGTPVDYLILDINPAYETITGFKRDDVIGRSIREVIPYVEPIWFERYDDVARNGRSIKFEEYNVGLDRWYSIRAYPMHKGNRFAVIFTDITGRKRNEEDLRKALERLSIAQRAAKIGFWDWNMITGELTWSPELFELFGFDPTDEPTFDTWLNVMHPDDREPAMAKINRSIEDRAYLENEYRIIRPDGEVCWISAIGNTLYDSEGRPQRMCGVCIDITDRKKADLALKEASKKLNLLTSITRHDILNQVTALKAFLVLLEDQRHDEGEAKEIFRNLEKIADTIRRQITFTGDYQEMGERDPEWQQVEWVVKRAAESVRLNWASLAVDTGPLEVFADPMLEKVFFNLLENAVFHGERVEHITVSFHGDGGTGVLVFEDDGVGVPASVKEKIFERGCGKVTGYGLFLVKEILDITGMSIRETGEEGKGARFEIEVPAGKWRMAEH